MQKNTKTHIYKTKHTILIIHYYQLLFTQDEKKIIAMYEFSVSGLIK